MSEEVAKESNWRMRSALRNKVSACRRFCGERKSVHATMVTTFGVRQGRHSGIVQSEVTLEDLFAF